MAAMSAWFGTAAWAKAPATGRTDIATGLIAKPIVQDVASKGAFPLVADGRCAPIWRDLDDHKGVLRAIDDLQRDIQSVTGATAALAGTQPSGQYVVIAGTLGKHRMIDALVASGKLDASDLRGKWESFVITQVSNPCPGVRQALVIAGSDKRGTIYGVYELCEHLGVSPWYWWADVPARKRQNAYVAAGRFASGEPVVRYRGIFINDEAPCLTRWTNEKFGGFTSEMYRHMFELILRLRGNYLWPAMWDSAFNEDDSENPRLADEYGIVMGTSHHEPMVRAQKEWTKSHERHGNGEWNYRTNEAGLKEFWREGVRRNKAYENLVTMGMRGDGDLAMPSAGGFRADVELLEKIITDQRQILREEVRPDVENVPQLWALFTEVQKYYDAGMKVPDDVTLLFTDDNVGNIRRLPTAEERHRKGGAGIYYHFDMHGGPYAYQWINTNPFPKIWEQMTLANEYGANRIWIANVGDLKPLELPIEFFIRLGWNPKAVARDGIGDYVRRWAERDFGAANGAEIADIVSRYTKYNGWRKPEMVQPDTYSLTHYREAERVEAAWQDVVTRAEALDKVIPQNQRDAFYQLVLYPAKASAGVTLMNISAGRSLYYARQGRASANDAAERTRALFRDDQAMSDYYNHTMAGGKWNHMMDQAHLGEYTWQPPKVNVMPPVAEVLVQDTNDFGVAIEGDDSAWPDHYGEPVLPPFDSLNPRRHYIEVFAKGRRAPDYKIAAKDPWIRISEDTAGGDKRYWVEIDWTLAPAGSFAGTVIITGNVPGQSWPKPLVTVQVKGVKATAEEVAKAKGRYASLTGPIAIAADGATRNIPAAGASWLPIPDYGRGAAAMAVTPVTIASILPPAQAPQLQYDVYLPKASTYQVALIVGPVLDFVKERGMRIAAAFDDEAPRIIDLFANREDETFLGKGHLEAAKNNVRTVTSVHKVATAGAHTLKILMVDPAIVVEKIVISGDPLPPSYFGPEDSRPV